MEGSTNSWGWLLLFSFACCYIKLTTSNQAEQEPSAAGCPAEYFHHVQVQPDKSVYGIGESVTLHCGNVEMLRHSMNRHSELQHHFKYIPYPNDRRVCQRDGTWTSPRPICTLVHASIDPARDLVNVTPANISHCENGACAIEGEGWVNVGSIEETCSSIDTELSATKESVLASFIFDRHFYMSFIHLPNSAGNTLRKIKVKAKRQDVISEMSIDSKELFAAHREAFRRSNNPKSCTVAQLATYTKEILVEFSVEASVKHANIPDVQFFAIPEQDSSKTGRRKQKPSCPKPPLIPHANLKSTTKPTQQNKESILYECHEGFHVIDSITQLWSKSFTLSCHGEYEWYPYPFPLCRQIKGFYDESFSSSLAIGIVDELLKLKSRNSYIVKRSVNQTDYSESVSKKGNEDDKEYIDNTLKYALLAAALLVGIIVGIAVVSVYFYHRSSKEKSKICANRIEQRHGIYNDRSQVDQDGYLVDLRDETNQVRYSVIPSSLRSNTARNVPNPAAPTRSPRQPNAQYIANDIAAFDPLFSSDPVESDDGYLRPIALHIETFENDSQGEYINLFQPNSGSHAK